MTDVVILEHLMQKGFKQPYLIHTIARHWRERGHRVRVHHGTGPPPPADIAIANIDLTVIPPAYVALFERYPKVINGAVTDMSKRKYSTQLLTRDSGYEGPVIVKTNANFGGRIERRLHRRARQAGHRSDITVGPLMMDYPILDSSADVPAAVWDNAGLIVEKFVPERDAHGYYMRVWIFLGDRERSFRLRAAEPIIKSRNMLEREIVPVPQEIRAWRRRLGYDFGKFDYVIHGGEPILIDANRTPGSPADHLTNAEFGRGMAILSHGLETLLDRT